MINRCVAILIVSLPLFYACTTSKQGFFSNGSPHEQYGRSLENAGLKSTTLGSKWFSAAESALQRPTAIKVPYRQTGYFAAEGHRAIGLSFSAKRGARVVISLEKNPGAGFLLFTELWATRPNGRPILVAAMDSTKTELSHDADDAGTFILRLQPELLQSGEYTLSISVAPSLGFPVAGSKGKVQSVWGDDRDAGTRRHEGIDIFAPKRTPLVAAVDGTVSRVEETAIGGKVVWLRPKGRNLNLYYAHLDTQLVHTGQEVRAGDTLGLMGNTGNARHTSPHLHFGIYGFGGAIDPLPFVSIKESKAEPLKTDLAVNRYARLKRDFTEGSVVLKKGTPVFVTDVGTGTALSNPPTGATLQIPPDFLQNVDNQLVTIRLKDTLSLFESPGAGAPVKRVLPGGASIGVKGTFNNYSFVVSDGITGWLLLPGQRPM